MRLPYFPIVPQNAPPDDLASYLELYSRQAVGMNPGGSFTHAEWDVNLPIPRMRALEGVAVTPLTLAGLERAFSMRGFAGVGEPMGSDPTLSFPSTGIAKVSALWAQRAINAFYAQNRRATRVVTDDRAGPQTLNALKAVRLAWLAGLPTPLSTSPRVVAMPTIVDRSHVSMAGDLYDALRNLVQVADVPATATTPTPEPDVVVAPESGGESGGVVLAVALGIGAAMWFGRRR